MAGHIDPASTSTTSKPPTTTTPSRSVVQLATGPLPQNGRYCERDTPAQASAAASASPRGLTRRRVEALLHGWDPDNDAGWGARITFVLAVTDFGSASVSGYWR
jgi:hypothetical protein